MAEDICELKLNLKILDHNIFNEPITETQTTIQDLVSAVIKEQDKQLEKFLLVSFGSLEALKSVGHLFVLESFPDLVTYERDEIVFTRRARLRLKTSEELKKEKA